MVAKRLELLRELVPTATRVAVLVNPTSGPSQEAAVRDLEAAARAMGLQIQVFNASASREIAASFANLVRERADALFVAGDPFLNSRRVQLAQLADRAGGEFRQAGRYLRQNRGAHRPQDIRWNAVKRA